MKEVKITVDKRSEVVDILLYLSDYRKEYPNLVLYNKDIKYVEDVYNHFKEFSNHVAVRLLNEIVEKHNFCYDAPFILAMQLNEDLSVGEIRDYPFKTRLKGDKLILDFMDAIKDFAIKSDFEGFYNEHQSYYQNIINATKNQLGDDWYSKVKEFYKLKSDIEYVINFLPLSAEGGAFYDYHHANKFISNIQNDEENSFGGFIENTTKRRAFNLFTLCLLRRYVEFGDYLIPKAQEFLDKEKSKFVTINNISYICEEIALVLRALSREIYSDSHSPAQEAIKGMKFDNIDRAYKILEILKEWQKSNDELNCYLQRLLNLF